MTAGFVDQILPRRPRSRRAVVGWMAFFLLFPLGYVGGSFLVQRDVRRHTAGIAIDRGSAIATARQFLTDRGIDVTTWSAYASVDPVRGLMDYYRAHRDSNVAETAQSFSLPVRVRVLLMSGAGDFAEVTLDRNGRLVGYDLTRVKAATTGAAVDESQARAIAIAALGRIPNLTKVLSLGQPEVGTQEHTEEGLCRKFTWRSATADLPGLTFEIAVPVCGTHAVGQGVKTTLEKDYAAAHRLGRRTSLTVLLTIYVVYMVIVFIYSFYRYARRAFEREVSHVRTLVLGGLIAVMFLLNFGTAIDEYVLGSYTAGQTVLWFPLVAVAITLVIMGLGIAIAYESGEGDLRELYPGKLTSLDALLRGKVFSRNVARSALFGTAFTGWMLLAEGVALLLLRIEGGISPDMLKLEFFRYPLIALFFAQAVAVTLIPASCLLLPLGFIHRNVRRVPLRNLLLLIFVFLGCLISASHWDALAGALIGAAMIAAIVLVPFRTMDFLAVTFSLLAWQVANTLARLVGISPSWTTLSIGVGCLALAFLAVQMWAALRGREYRDEEVKPLYARHIAERQLLEAEMAAARVAQLHLLPKTVPSIYGLSISASCIPARIVGGDFYDFFPLANDRLGIFIAEGGNRGIGSALNIALAKGFLMHTVRRNLPPHEVIMRLEAALGDLLAGTSATTSVAYAVLDLSIGQIRYARTGEYPKVVVPTRPAQEIRIDMPGSKKAIYAATLDLRGGDSILLFTDGIARRVRTSGSGAADEMVRVLRRRRCESELEDDLTAVVVRVTRVGAAIEDVA